MHFKIQLTWKSLQIHPGRRRLMAVRARGFGSVPSFAAPEATPGINPLRDGNGEQRDWLEFSLPKVVGLRG
jgi:hypothetical protein